MTKKYLIGVLAVLALFVPMACAKASDFSGAPASAPAPAPSPASALAAAPTSVRADAGVPARAWSEDRLIVRTADMSLVVQDVPKAMAGIIDLAESFSGYEVASRNWRENDRVFGSIRFAYHPTSPTKRWRH